MGLEVAGNVVAAGKGSPDGKWATGLRAHAWAAAMPEYTSTPAEHCLPIPRGLGHARGGGVARELLHGLGERVRDPEAQRGETSSCTEARAASAHRDPARQGVRRDGLHHRGQRREDRLLHEGRRDHAINYRTHDFEAEIAAIVGKRGVDVILDMVAATTSTRT
jgi:NADPH:quinone reductase-like Zn-dependent oxidoreductase